MRPQRLRAVADPRELLQPQLAAAVEESPARRAAAAGAARPPRRRRRGARASAAAASARSSRSPRRSRRCSPRSPSRASSSPCAHRSTARANTRRSAASPPLRCCPSASCTTCTASRRSATPICCPRCRPTRTASTPRRRRAELRHPLRADPLRRLRVDPVRDRDRRRGRPRTPGAAVLQAPRPRAALQRSRLRARAFRSPSASRRSPRVAHATRVLRRRSSARSASSRPARAQRWRVVHAELERIANHLDVATKLAEDAALVGRRRALRRSSRSRSMRLRARLCGSRFGRGVVVARRRRRGAACCEPKTVLTVLDEFERQLRRDRRLLLGTASFTDRLIGSGTPRPRTPSTPTPASARSPAAPASPTDARFERPYGAYVRVGGRDRHREDGDAMAPARRPLRRDRARASTSSGRRFERLDEVRPRAPRRRSRREAAPPSAGRRRRRASSSTGSRSTSGRIGTVRIASPSLRNWPLFAASFRGDVLTDFAFIEHSFGLTPAGADR